MHEIGQHVPVLPVVTKADTMTCAEAQAYRADVAAKLANPKVRNAKTLLRCERKTTVGIPLRFPV